MCEKTAAEAYSWLGINNDSTPDKNIVVACYSRCSGHTTWGTDALGALKAIAHERKSRFLLFIISIHKHLTDSNVTILAKTFPTELAESVTSPGPEHVENEHSENEHLENEHFENEFSSQTAASISSDSEMVEDEYGEVQGTPEESERESELRSPSTSEADTTPSSD